MLPMVYALRGASFHSRYLVLLLCIASGAGGFLWLGAASAAAPAIALSSNRLIFYEFITGGFDPVQAITIRNTGDATLQISSITLNDPASPDQFALVGAPPTSITPGGQATLQVTFNPSSTGVKVATLQIASNAAGAARVVELRGLGLESKNSEPSLQWIADTFNLGISVADPDPATNPLGRSPLLWGNEIAAQRFRKAGPGPVTVEPIALFGPTDVDPVARFGWYPSANPASRSELFVVPVTAARSLYPTLNPGGSTSFIPAGDFGLWSFWPRFPNQEASYSEDALNTWSSIYRRHKLRVYPLAQANAYLVATEETTGDDYQDIVVILRNVVPSPLEQTLEFNTTYPGTTLDQDGQPLGFVTTQKNSRDTITTEGPPGSYDPNRLDLITDQGVLRVTTTQTSSAQNGFENLINGLQLPYDPTRPFTVSTRLKGPLTQMSADSQQAGIFIGPSEDNFIKLIVARLGGQNVIELYQETNDSGASFKNALPSLASIVSVELMLVGDPAAGTVRALYRIVTTSGDQGLQPLLSNGQPRVLTLSATQRPLYFGTSGWAGITASGRVLNTPVINFDFDRFAISYPQLVATPTATATPSHTATATPSHTATATPSHTATATPSRTATSTPSRTATSTPSRTATSTRTAPTAGTGVPGTATATRTATVTSTATATQAGVTSTSTRTTLPATSTVAVLATRTGTATAVAAPQPQIYLPSVVR